MVKQVSLTSLQDEVIKAFTRYTLMQDVVSPGDRWLEAISGPVIETPAQRYLKHGWVDSIEDFHGAQGGLTEDTIGGDDLRREYYSRGKAFRVLYDELELGQIGEVRRRISDMATAYRRLWAIDAIQVILDAAAAVDNSYTQSIDQAVLFSDAHDNGGDNKYTHAGVGSVADPSASDFEKAIWKSVEVIAQFEDDAGRTKNDTASEFVLMVPWQYYRAAKHALGATLILDGGQTRENLLAAEKNGMGFQIVVSTKFSAWTDKFALFIADGKTLQRGRDPISMKVRSKDAGIQHQYIRYATLEKRAVMAWQWESSLLTTLTT